MRVPLVVVTGFLGAGKTTLVNRLLARRAERHATGKIGIIVNELGEVGIDGALLGGETARQIELPGGCVCCVLGDELDRTLIDLVDKNPSLEAIVLETTGVAEPLPIAWAVQREPVCERVRLAAVVTLVDAANFRASRPVTAAVDAQVAYSDVLLVSKAEVAGEAETLAMIEDAHAIAPKALVRRGTTDEHAAWLEQLLADPDLEHAAGDRASSGHSHDHGSHDHSSGQCRHPDSHAHGIDSTWLFVEHAVDVEELEDQLAELSANYVRIKGIVRDASGQWYAVHRVGLRVSSEPIVRNADDLLGENGRIVALGTDLAPGKLAECLRAAYLG
ncbi:MAG TPA: GTP-binding protein [Kofleriaceae bacterium]|nr:GTP-binding protein [Kofleriaceae bacterium]